MTFVVIITLECAIWHCWSYCAANHASHGCWRCAQTVDISCQALASAMSQGRANEIAHMDVSIALCSTLDVMIWSKFWSSQMSDWMLGNCPWWWSVGVHCAESAFSQPSGSRRWVWQEWGGCRSAVEHGLWFCWSGVRDSSASARWVTGYKTN